MKQYFLIAALVCAAPIFNTHAQGKQDYLQIVFTSDIHYGIFRKQFEGEDSVPSYKVNAAMVARINTLPGVILPEDDGVASNSRVGAIDYLAITGDIANREQVPYQSATASWQQFQQCYMKGLTITNAKGAKTPLLLTSGNHDGSDAVGYYKTMNPATDPAAMTGIYNLMMHPPKPKTAKDFNYYKDKINYSKDISGIHFMFVELWPDSTNRIWMEKDLRNVSAATPVIIFTHVPPQGDGRLFFNPKPPYTINAKDQFENLLSEHLKDKISKNEKGKISDIIEQRAFVAFLKKHPNIKAYFHGHENSNEFYTYKGPDKDISLPVFRVDSPMKGKFSSKDETQLSFQLITIDTKNKKMTVRECLWNKHADKASMKVHWGDHTTISLK
jgi:hypothetical protein